MILYKGGVGKNMTSEENIYPCYKVFFHSNSSWIIASDFPFIFKYDL